MIPPKEKAQELIQKYYPLTKDSFTSLKYAKQCAVIAIDEIKKCVLYTSQKFENDRFSEDYWEEVKHELNNERIR